MPRPPDAPTPSAPLIFGQDKRGPWFAYPHTVADVSAVQAVARGDANADQQIRAFDWIMRTAAGTWQDTFHPDSDRVSNFMQGRRYVGLKLQAMLTVSVPDLLKRQQGD